MMSVNGLAVGAEEAGKQWEAEKEGFAQPFDWGFLSELEESDEPEFRIGDLLPAGGGMAVVAQRKTGKTTLTLNLARSLLTGKAFLDRFWTVPATGPVALLNYEVSGRQIQRWARATAGMPEDKLFLVHLRGQRNPLGNKADRQELADKLREIGTETLIVDPFGRAFTGNNQDNNGEVGAWLSDLDLFARSEAGVKEVILTVHAGWNGERARGASALEDWADSIVTMTFGKDKETRYLRAFGRDVQVDEDQLMYDRDTRLLSMAGTGSRAQVRQAAVAAELTEPVLKYIVDHPGASRADIVQGLRDQREAGKISVGFQDAAVSNAIKEAEASGLIRIDKGKPGAGHRHYPSVPFLESVPPERVTS